MDTTTAQDAAAEISTLRIVEALLFSTDVPLSADKLAKIVGVGTPGEMKEHVETLNEGYERDGNAFRITEVAGGYRMLTLPTFNTWLNRLLRSRADSRLSGAALETLAVVAYKQPVLRAEIEAIRGVACGDVLNRLREMGLIKIVGRAEDLGRPMLYGTTRKFLDLFGLADLESLPQVEQLRPPPA